jgi:broad specificity phosphatase PhoE
MRLYLIRHGQSEANTDNLVTGTESDKLTADGIRQVEHLKSYLEQIKFDHSRYVTSDWRRAAQTAEILWPNADWIVDSRVGETMAGEVAEYPLDYFLKLYPHFYETPANQYPLGESHLNLNSRVLAWLDEQLFNGVTSIVLVTHSGPIACLIQNALGISMDSFPAVKPSNASLSIIEYSLNNPKGVYAKVIGFSLLPHNRLMSVLDNH